MDLVSGYCLSQRGHELMRNSEQEFYAYPCENIFNISISFGNHNFVINDGDFNMGTTDAN